MSSTVKSRIPEPMAPTRAVRREGDGTRAAAEESPVASRAERFKAAHDWVLEHHANTFAKLAK